MCAAKLISVALFLLSSLSASAESDDFVSADRDIGGLVLQVRVVNKGFAGQPILLSVRLKNISDSSQKIPELRLFETLKISIVDLDLKKDVLLTEYGKHLETLSSRSVKKEIKPLGLDASNFLISRIFDLTFSGKYELQVEFLRRVGGEWKNVKITGIMILVRNPKEEELEVLSEYKN
jgi:hypothetical protein